MESDFVFAVIGGEACYLYCDWWRGMLFVLGLVESDIICAVIGG